MESRSGQKRQREGSSSRFKGVAWDKASSAWNVRLWVPQTQSSHYAGSYASEEDAARAYDCVAVQTHGPGAARNFPGEVITEMPVRVGKERREERKQRTSSRYNSVAWHRASSSWHVRLWDPHAKRERSIGYYATEEAAARAYDCAAVQALGPGTKRNFQDEIISEPPMTVRQEQKQRSSSRFLGVNWFKDRSLWTVTLNNPQRKRPRFIGSFAPEEDAARAYDFAAVQVLGPGAKRNYPGEVVSEPPMTAGEMRKQRSSSKFMGVCWNKITSAWIVTQWDPETKRTQSFGSYTSEEDAARAYDCAAVQAHGPGAKRNFPGETISEQPVTVGEKAKQRKSSHFIGVALEKSSSSWVVNMRDPQTKNSRTVGRFASEEDAARAYDCVVVQEYEPGTKRNFPGEVINEQPVTVGQQRKQRKSLRYVGVSWAKVSFAWSAFINDSENKHKQHLGLFASEEDAARAYDCAAVQAHGAGALRNFPGEVISEVPVTVNEARKQERKQRCSTR
ncbi:hypothetical protein FOA52_011500 [Chlamydomonas sp. UWO 241]|nr:hypothetical protein FOA52_011500 [Chlamydomonas sp. UWO 241]